MTRAIAAALAVLAVLAGRAVAEPAGKPACDANGLCEVIVREPPPAAHRLAISWHPLPLIAGFGKLELDAQLVPLDHHAIILNGFYSQTATAPIALQDATGMPTLQLPEQKFTAIGLELGYRYYGGLAGPRGWFVGPSLIAARVHEAQGRFGDGSTTDYMDFGVAVDVGYAAVVDHVALSAGLGAQGLVTSRTIPPQQFPARTYADAGISPRFVASVGYAF
jgi:hypothetical protein